MSYRYRRQRRSNDHQVDDWLMTYADMITLLLCFFAVFLSVSVPKEEAFKQARQEVLERFSSPDAPKEIRIIPLSEKPQADLPYNRLPSIVANYEELKQVRIQKKGDRITVIDMDSAPLFTRGSAALSEEGETLLSGVMNTLSDPKYEGYRITVEGHTDDIPIATPQFPSNWELSTARAASVVRFFIGQGLPAEKLRASGYADTFPKLPNRDVAGKAIPENQAANRRVVIKLERIEEGD